MKEKDIEITMVKIAKWTIPYFGNNHVIPYGTLAVTGTVNGGTPVTMMCRTKGDMVGDTTPQYITFQGARFFVRNKGTLHSPCLTLERWHKTKNSEGKNVYVNPSWY